MNTRLARLGAAAATHPWRTLAGWLLILAVTVGLAATVGGEPHDDVAPTLGRPRLGLSIAARSIAHAVARNRIRRLVREGFRLAQHDLPPVDLVVAARPAARNDSAAELRADLARALNAVRKQCDSSSNRSSTPTAG